MSSASPGSPWRAFHFYYHDRRDRVLVHLVHPLVCSLFAEQLIDSFFFIRFPLGGRHVRLRLRLSGEHEDRVSAAVADAAERFFDELPSRRTQTGTEIRKYHDGLLRHDPNESDDSIYPDNSWRQAPYHPETERYGGPRLLPHSHKFFAFSSYRVLRFLHEQGGDPGAELFPFALRWVNRLALGFASGAEEYLKLLRYPAGSWKVVPLFAERGDQVFEGQREGFLRILRGQIEDLSRPPSPWDDAEAARRLGTGIGAGSHRHQILSSHLHLTANRLGIEQEGYLVRLIWRTASALVEEDPALWSELDRLLAERMSSSGTHFDTTDLGPLLCDSRSARDAR